MPAEVAADPHRGGNDLDGLAVPVEGGHTLAHPQAFDITHRQLGAFAADVGEPLLNVIHFGPQAAARSGSAPVMRLSLMWFKGSMAVTAEAQDSQNCSSFLGCHRRQAVRTPSSPPAADTPTNLR